jgi:hypothetical protein
MVPAAGGSPLSAGMGADRCPREHRIRLAAQPLRPHFGCELIPAIWNPAAGKPPDQIGAGVDDPGGAVEALPRNHMGKVERARLRAWLASETALSAAA